MRKDPLHILVVRNDGLGDFILTLPLIASLKQQLPQSRITVLVNEGLLPLVGLLPEIEDAIGDGGFLLRRHRHRHPPRETRMGRQALLENIRARNFDAAILPYAELQSARLIHKAGIPLRAGPLRRLFFWHFNVLNRRSRKGSLDSEYALNLDYLECLGLKSEYRRPALRLPGGEGGNAQGSGETSGGETAQPTPGLAVGPIVMHPHKRSGTAPSWPLERFVELARELARSPGTPPGGAGNGDAANEVVVVGDEEDRPVLERHFPGIPGVRIETGCSLPELTELIAGARLFVGNSSGPLHLAGLTGIPHVGLYPQNRASAPERWRTLPGEGAPEDFRRYLLAPAFPRNCTVCDKERCPHFNCVASIGMDQIWEAVQSWGLKMEASIPKDESLEGGPPGGGPPSSGP